MAIDYLRFFHLSAYAESKGKTGENAISASSLKMPAAQLEDHEQSFLIAGVNSTRYCQAGYPTFATVKSGGSEMIAKLLVGIAVSVFSVSCAAQVTSPSTYRPPLATSVGAGLTYWSGDWGTGDINRLGPSVWGTVTIWHDLSIIAEGHSMVMGGNNLASNYKYFSGGGGLVYTSDYFGRFQPLVKAEAGFASLSHPSNFSGNLHDTRNTWTLGGGVEYHTAGHWWTRVEYDYDFFPGFHSSITNQNHTLNPRGFVFGETYRFGPSGSRF